jgi:hypothetical protein
MTDYEVGRPTRHCAASERELQPGESFYSALIRDGTELRRVDYATEAWQGPPEGSVGWWKSQIPEPGARRPHWAPNDVMLEFFDELADQAEQEDVRYVLALLLVRRRVMRLEETERDAAGGETLVLYCPRREETYHVPAVQPSAERVDEIQEQLAGLLQG